MQEEQHVIETGTVINNCKLYLVFAAPRENGTCTWSPTPWVPVLVNTSLEGTCRGSECGSFRNRCVHIKKLSNHNSEIGEPCVEVGTNEYKPNAAAEVIAGYVNIQFGRGLQYQSEATLRYEREFVVKHEYSACLYPCCVCSESISVDTCKCGFRCSECQSEWSHSEFSPARVVNLYHDSCVTEVRVRDRRCSSCGNCLRWDGTDEGIFCSTLATAITHKKLYQYLDLVSNGGSTFEHMHAASVAAYTRNSHTFMDKVCYDV